MKKLLPLLFSLCFSNLLCHAQSPKTVVQLGHQSWMTSIDFSQDGKLVVTGGLGGRAIVWDALSKREVAGFKTAGAHDVAINANNRYIASCQNDLLVQDLQVFDILEEREVTSFSPNFIDVKENPKALLKNPYEPIHRRLIDFHPKEKHWLAVGSSGKEENVSVWDIQSGEEIKDFKGHKDRITVVAFSPNGDWLATGSEDQQVLIWEVSTGKILHKISHNSPVTSLNFSGNSQFIASGDLKGNILIHQTNDGKLINSQNMSQAIADVALSENGQQLAATDLSSLTFWNAPFSGVGERLLHRPLDNFEYFKGLSGGYTNFGKANYVAFSPNGNTLATSVLIPFAFNTNTLKEVGTFAKGSIGMWVGAIAWEQNTQQVVSIHSGLESSYAKFWDGQQFQGVPIPLDGKNTFVISPGGQYAFSFPVNYLLPNPQHILWNIRTGEQLASFPLAQPITDAVFTEAGTLITVGMDNHLRVWEVPTGKELLALTGRYSSQKTGLLQVVASKDGAVAYATSLEGPVQIFDIVKKERSYSIGEMHNGRRIGVLACSPDGKFVVTANRLYKVEGKELLQTFGEAKEVDKSKKTTAALIQNSYAFGDVLGKDQFNNEAVFSPDGDLLAYTDGVRIQVFETSSGKQLYSLKGHQQNVNHLAFSPDGRQLLSSAQDFTVRIWEMGQAEPKAVLLSLNQEDFAITIEGGYYFITKNASPRLHFVQDLRAFPFEQFDAFYNRPDLILKQLNSNNTKLIQAYHKAYQKRLRKLKLSEEDFVKKLEVPTVQITNTKVPLSTHEPTFDLKLKMKEEQYALKKLLIKVNQVPIQGLSQGIELKGKEEEKTVPISLSKGENLIEIAVWNDKGIKSMVQQLNIIYNGDKAKPKLWIFAVGVSSYPKEENNLMGPVKDVEAIEELYAPANHWKYSSVEVITLKDEQASKEGVMQAAEFLKKASVDDDVMVFFAGHGLLNAEQEFYFACHDVDFMKPSVNGLSFAALEALFEGVKARNRLMMIDACHSGEVDKELLAVEKAKRTKKGKIGFREVNGDVDYSHVNDNGLGLRNSFELMKNLFADLRESTGVTVIAASSGTELATEDSDAGFFTHAFIEGISTKKADKNQDGQIRISELREYVYDQVSIRTGGRQNPTSRKENLVNDFVVW